MINTSRTLKAVIIILGVTLFPIVTGLIFFQYALADFYEFNDVPTTEAPFPLLTLDEHRLHITIEGSLELDGFLGAEERQARFHLPLGFIASTIFEKDKFPDFPEIALEDIKAAHMGHHGDSPFLTGHYLTAQALRWACYARVGNSAGLTAAETQIDRVLDGLWILLHVSGNPGHLVRNAFPIGSFPGSEIDNGNNRFGGRFSPNTITPTRWGPVTNPSHDWSGWVYADDTSRDQNLGVMFGLAGVLGFCGNTTLKARAGALVCEIVDCMERDNWQVAEVTGDDTTFRASNSADFDLGFLASRMNRLEFLKLASIVNPAKYGPKYQDAIVILNDLGTLGHEGLRSAIVTTYYPINLAWETMWPLVFFEEPASQGGIRETYLDVFEHVHYATVKNHRNAFYQCLWLSVLPPDRFATETRVFAEIQDSLERMSRERWNGFNIYPGANFSEIGLDITNPADHSSLIDPKSLNYEKMFVWMNNILGDTLEDISPFQEHTKWATPVDWRPPTDFVWQRVPFEYMNGTANRSRIETPQADFTIVYWFARYLGIVGNPTRTFTPAVIPLDYVAIVWENYLWPSFGTNNKILEGLP